MRTYTVYYTKTTQGSVEIEASSPTEASEMVERGDFDEGGAQEYDEGTEVYSVE
ncbi:MAG TPA: hypothetical protein PLW50_00075 [Smithellaceae bacterium]|nr:hypothetical protein [Smithellaceae bacterium]